jgi:DNA polymerase elongation subunit (family B)
MEAPWIEKELSSSALGNNYLYYYDMIGRVPIDLMKVVMKDYNLGSYKLDNVAATFIRGNIHNFIVNKEEKTTDISTDTTYGLEKGRYISVYYNDGLSDNKFGEKFKIIKMSDKYSFTVTGALDHKELDGNKIFWCQAKDDVSPADIFRLQKGDAKDRAIVAKYCIQDCALCNRLLSKLQVLTNNVGMANVCGVPLAYLFLRGQGIKGLSLISRKCRELNYLIPTIRKPYIPDDPVEAERVLARLEPETDPVFKIDDGGYQGAIVVPPKKTGVFFTPIVVLDYASLYPRCMIHRNLSHESYVIEPEYDNLPGYEYIDVKVNKKTTHRFAKRKDGKPGVLPTILWELLNERSRVKKLMKNAKDPFKKMVFNGRQLALKISANSVYGITGASTSALYLKAIAESTTATGRDMLAFATHFIEKPFKDMYTSIVNGRIKAYKETAYKLLEKKPSEAFKNEKQGWICKGDFINWFLKKMMQFICYEVNPEVVYGDSVTGETPLIIRQNGIIKLVKFSDLEGDWYDYGDKKAFYGEKLEAWTEKGWTKINKVIKHKTSKKIYRVSTHTGCVDVTEDHSLIDENANKISPKECDIGTKLMQSFPDITNIDCNVKGVNNEQLKLQLEYIKNKPKDKVNDNEIIKICDVSKYYYKDTKEIIVYDLETENHHFQAGVGNIIVHNTDSIFVDFHMKGAWNHKNKEDREGLDLAIKLGVLAGEFIHYVLPEPHDLEYEKTFWPFCLLKKKRYVGHLYEFDPNKFKFKCMGVELKRRDNSPIVKIVTGGIIKSILEERSIGKAVEFLKSALSNILKGKYPMSKFVVSKTLRGEYKDRTRIVHAVLADRMAKRDPGNKPQANDRIPYAYIRLDREPKLQGERVETPQYIKEKGLELDYLFYITNQIQKPSIKFLECLMDNPDKIFKEYIAREVNRRRGRKPLAYYFGKVTDSGNDAEEEEFMIDDFGIKNDDFGNISDDESDDDIANIKKFKTTSNILKSVKTNKKTKSKSKSKSKKAKGKDKPFAKECRQKDVKITEDGIYFDFD